MKRGSNDFLKHCSNPKLNDKSVKKRRRKLFNLNEDKTIEKKSKSRYKEYFYGLVRDIIVSAIIVFSVLGILFMYSGVWPPMVVIESSSMMHGNDSQIGVIDTGDLTLVKKINNRHDIVTYVEATCRTSPKYGVMTYGDFGHVIVYKKNGLSDTPVIHRAIAWVEYNRTASCMTTHDIRGDIPDINVYNVKFYTIKNQGYRKEDLTISFNVIFSQKQDSGFLTKGDHNIQKVDQESLRVNGALVAPVKLEWIVGRAEGELPWFGLFKLWVTGHRSETFPETSVRGLIITIVILVVIPISIDFIISILKKRKTKRKDLRAKLKKKY